MNGKWRVEAGTGGACNDIVRAVNAHDSLIEVNADLLAALKALVSTGRAGLCWCDASHDVEVYGHQGKCVNARILVAVHAEEVR